MNKITRTAIDHIIINFGKTKTKSKITTHKLADHYPISLEIIGSKLKRNKDVSGNKKFQKINNKGVADQLNKINWKEVLINENVEKDYDRWIDRSLFLPQVV